MCLLPVFLLSTLSSQFADLSVSQQDYFYHLASGNDSTVFDYFEAVPEELRGDPALVEKYLNGDPELGVSDKDWSHVESRHNGGSDEADNGFFEDFSTNRSRGADNTTEQEVFEADVESEEDVQTLLESAEDVADATVWAEAAEFAGGAVEVGLDFLAPLVGGGVAAKAAYDRFEEPRDKWGFGSLAGGATVAVLCTPVGQAAIAGYVGYRVFQRGSRLWQKHVAKA